MERKFVNLDVKANTEDRTISGYGSVFGNVDGSGDIVASGAFQKSLSSGRRVKMLWQHNPNEVVGVWTSVTEDANGLRVEGKLADTPRGNELYALMKMGAIDGLSIGYRTVSFEWKQDNRVIREADVLEVSLVTFPMNEEAKIDAVKAADLSAREFERKLTQDAGFSRSVARALMSGGLDAVKSMPGAGDDAMRELRELLEARAKL